MRLGGPSLAAGGLGQRCVHLMSLGWGSKHAAFPRTAVLYVLLVNGDGSSYRSIRSLKGALATARFEHLEIPRAHHRNVDNR
jgi:hypothetical protein